VDLVGHGYPETSSSFNSKSQEVILIAADVIRMDHLLRRYGPEAEGYVICCAAILQ
jgi:hypothetical protein